MKFVEVLGSGKAYINAEEITRLYVKNLGETDDEKKSGRVAIVIAVLRDCSSITLFKGNANGCGWFIDELVEKLNK